MMIILSWITFVMGGFLVMAGGMDIGEKCFCISLFIYFVSSYLLNLFVIANYIH